MGDKVMSQVIAPSPFFPVLFPLGVIFVRQLSSCLMFKGNIFCLKSIVVFLLCLYITTYEAVDLLKYIRCEIVYALKVPMTEL